MERCGRVPLESINLKYIRFERSSKITGSNRQGDR